MSEWRVVAHVVNGGHPERPSLSECHGFALPDTLWSLLTYCWSQDPRERLSMETIVTELQQVFPEIQESQDLLNWSYTKHNVDLLDVIGIALPPAFPLASSPIHIS
jgi:hypothetical protein